MIEIHNLQKKAENLITDNLGDRIKDLNRRQNNDKPKKQIDDVNKTLKSINPKARAFTEKATITGIGEAVENGIDLLKKAGTFGKLQLLKKVLKMLTEMDSFSTEDLEDGKILTEMKEISSAAHTLKKNAGG